MKHWYRLTAGLMFVGLASLVIFFFVVLITMLGPDTTATGFVILGVLGLSYLIGGAYEEHQRRKKEPSNDDWYSR